MSPNPSKCNVSPTLRITLLILGLAIFAWGLQYKLSLYDTPYHPNPVRIAKLMQGDQPGKKFAVSHMRDCATELQSALDRPALCFLPPFLVRPNRPIEKPVLSPPPLASECQFVRPPPQAS
jgi:hypothetical protein